MIQKVPRSWKYSNVYGRAWIAINQQCNSGNFKKTWRKTQSVCRVTVFRYVNKNPGVPTSTEINKIWDRNPWWNTTNTNIYIYAIEVYSKRMTCPVWNRFKQWIQYASHVTPNYNIKFLLSYQHKENMGKPVTKYKRWQKNTTFIL